jgi:hypothetical protein
MAADVDLANVALVELRAKTITSFDQATNEARVAKACYKPRLLELFAEHRWRFAAWQQKLVQEVTPPDARWASYWTLPAGLLLLHTVTLNDTPIEYDVYGNSVAANLSADDVPVADYTKEVSPSYFPPWFYALAIAKLKISFAGGITGKAELIADARKEYAQALLDAKRANAQMRTARNMQPTRLITYR